ncbi:hypothetical protein VA7868_03685 [Vibrio aerogenes CECT 7868]|uniref:Uncharacterized protein n=1 Tax=Vibrio aerogenes CECT 7868 TaxID=1216006 RepID=A0A1M6B1B0_9VIBR|nr:hypothetical protein [Vibrio aerogenes]SHI42512.1 hypothetical protein VA7868_03685 [Vibrio aerogenes CECT 7868]
MKFTKFVAPLLLLPSLAFAHSTEMMFSVPVPECGSTTARFDLNLSNLSDHAANVKVEFYSRSGQSVTPDIVLNSNYKDFIPGEEVSIPANNTFAYQGSFYNLNSSHNKCSEFPAIVKIIKDKNSEIMANGWSTLDSGNIMAYHVNQGKAF